MFLYKERTRFLLKKYQICFGAKLKMVIFIKKNQICFVNKKV